jgi:hypothetical protein
VVVGDEVEGAAGFSGEAGIKIKKGMSRSSCLGNMVF